MDDEKTMRLSRASLLFAVATLLQGSLHAATHTIRHATPGPVVVRHANDAVRHLSLTGPYLPAEPVPSSVNPSIASRGFSVASFAIHSVLGLFGHGTP